jgi:hypothetical protein
MSGRELKLMSDAELLFNIMREEICSLLNRVVPNMPALTDEKVRTAVHNALFTAVRSMETPDRIKETLAGILRYEK